MSNFEKALDYSIHKKHQVTGVRPTCSHDTLTHIVERMRNLTKAVRFDGFHQRCEYVGKIPRGLLQAAQPFRRIGSSIRTSSDAIRADRPQSPAKPHAPAIPDKGSLRRPSGRSSPRWGRCSAAIRVGGHRRRPVRRVHGKRHQRRASSSNASSIGSRSKTAK